MSKKAIIIKAPREVYEPSEAEAMTTRELISELQSLDPDAIVLLSHDNGYTFTGVRAENIYTKTLKP